MRSWAGVRVIVLAVKHRNGCGAKGDRKIDAQGNTSGKQTNASAGKG